MKKQLLLKTLLAAVLLCVGGSSAWAQIIYSWEGGTPATETGGKAAASDGVSVNYDNTANGVAYKIIRLNGNSDFSDNTVTITLSANTLQAGDVIRVTGYRNKDNASSPSGFKAKFENGSDNVESASGTDFNNIYSSGKPNTFSFNVPASAAGSSTITMTRSHTGTNLFITKIQVVRPIVNANIDFSNAITGTSPYTISGTVSSMTWTQQWTVTPSVADGMLRVGNFEGKVALTGDPAGTKDIVTLSFDYGHVGLTNKETMRFTIYDVDGGEIVSEKLNVYGKSFSSNTLGLDVDNLVYVSSDNPGMVANNKNSYTINLNYETKKINGSVVNKNGTYPFEIDMPLGTKAVGSFSVGANINNFESRRSYFDNLLIKTIVGDYSTTKTITYAYKDDSDNDITDFMTSHGGMSSDSGESGEEYTPLYPSSATTDDYAYDYTYASGGDAFTVTGNATVTLVYTKSAHPTTNVTLQYKSGGVVKKEEVIAEGYPVGKPISYGVHQYLMGNDGVFYQTSTGSNWYYRTANAAATIAENVTASGINNVVYFTEAEAVSGAGSQDMTSRASNGKVGYTTNSDTYVNATTLAPGKYRIYMRTVTANTGARTFNFKVGEDNVYSHYVNGSNTNNVQNSDEFTVLSSSALSFAADGGNANGNGLDWFYVVKTAESKNISAAGWATYCSPYALDLENATGLEDAYIVTGGTGGVLAKTSVKGGTVPANTGLLLKGDEGTVTIPVVGSSSTDVSGNELVGVTTNTVIAANTGYVLMNDATNGLGFYKNSNAFTVGANTAYLPVGFATDAARSFFSLDDATAIDDVRSKMSDGRSEYFNLAGQRVAQPQKGLYIVNGKKVIIK